MKKTFFNRAVCIIFLACLGTIPQGLAQTNRAAVVSPGYLTRSVPGPRFPPAPKPPAAQSDTRSSSSPSPAESQPREARTEGLFKKPTVTDISTCTSWEAPDFISPKMLVKFFEKEHEFTPGLFGTVHFKPPIQAESAEQMPTATAPKD